MTDDESDLPFDLAREARIFGEPLMSDTHYTLADALVSRTGMTMAVCGVRVNEHWGETDNQAPTCPKCQQWLEDRNQALEATDQRGD